MPSAPSHVSGTREHCDYNELATKAAQDFWQSSKKSQKAQRGQYRVLLVFCMRQTPAVTTTPLESLLLSQTAVEEQRCT